MIFRIDGFIPGEYKEIIHFILIILSYIIRYRAFSCGPAGNILSGSDFAADSDVHIIPPSRSDVKQGIRRSDGIRYRMAVRQPEIRTVFRWLSLTA